MTQVLENSHGARTLFFHAEEAPEGGFVARAADEPIFTEADTYEELQAAIRDAVRCHFDDEQRPSAFTIVQVRSETFAT